MTSAPFAAPTAAPDSPSATTTETTLVPTTPGDGGYRRLQQGSGEPHLPRSDLGGPRPSASLRPLLAFVQVSDLHVVDAQSPARAEFLDRLADPDSPVAAGVGPLGSYRPQEALSYHVVESMARAIHRLGNGPVTGMPLAFVVSTGDNADNGQRNEVESYIALLDGGCWVRPDSGSLHGWEGVGSPAWYDVRYWHPDGTPPGEPDDIPRGGRGFPTVPGLLDACRQPFAATGVGLPWYEVHGNHDQLLGGTLPGEPGLARLARGGRKAYEMAQAGEPEAVAAILGDHERQPPDLFGGLGKMRWRKVTRDRGRSLVGTAGWLLAHRRNGSRTGRFHPWYGFDAGEFRCLVLDTVNANGGWQGSLDAEQWEWLQKELETGSSTWRDAQGRRQHADRPDRTFLLFSHHPLSTLVNDWSPAGDRRVLAGDVSDLLTRFPNVAAWFNGHTHVHHIEAHPAPDRVTSSQSGWWEITTASHADWPQQARVVEIAQDPADGALVIITTVLDHRGLIDPRSGDLGDPVVLAGWSRELALNHWQRVRRGGEPPGRGRPLDRNTALVLPGS